MSRRATTTFSARTYPASTRTTCRSRSRTTNLTISGERRLEEGTEQNAYWRIERSYGHFSRSLGMPEGIDPDGISARFENGVLEVRVPKPAERKPRRVSIGLGGGEPRAVEGTASERPASGSGAPGA